MPVTFPSAKIVDAFAHNAGPDFINSIPETTAAPGAASFDQGFPPVTMEAPAAGGIPPYGQDFNGILNQITALLAYLNSGNCFPYDGTYATDIGGYAIGAILQRADLTGFWYNLLAANTSNPDSGGAGWVGLSNYGFGSIAVAAGVNTLDALDAARPVIVVSGTLGGNAQLVLPNTLQQWLIVNNTAGGHTLTVKTAAGTGVNVPAGGFAAPTGVYGDGTNIYPSFSPLTVPIDQAPTPSTLVERDNLGNVLAVRFNSNEGVETGVTVGSVIVMASSADGFYRAVGLADFIKQLGIGGLPQIRAGTFNSVNGTATVAFGAAFPNSIISVVCYGVYVGWDLGNVIPGSETVNGFQFHNSNAGLMNYIAIGT